MLIISTHAGQTTQSNNSVVYLGYLRQSSGMLPQSRKWSLISYEQN